MRELERESLQAASLPPAACPAAPPSPWTAAKAPSNSPRQCTWVASIAAATCSVAPGGNSTVSFNWTVAPAPPVNTAPVPTNPGNQSGTVGTAISVQLAATDADGDILTYSATGLPAGLSIDAGTGRIGGTPTAAGASTVTVIVSDNRGGSGTASFSWAVAAKAAGGGGGGSLGSFGALLLGLAGLVGRRRRREDQRESSLRDNAR